MIQAASFIDSCRFQQQQMLLYYFFTDIFLFSAFISECHLYVCKKFIHNIYLKGKK